MDLFQTRYDALIRQLGQVPSAAMKDPNSVWLTLSLVVRDTIFWDSGFVDLSSPIPRIPEYLDIPPRQRTWRLGVHALSLDGLSMLSKYWNLVAEDVGLMEKWYSTFPPPRVLPPLRLKFEGIWIPVFHRNNKLRGVLRGLLRARAVKARVESSVVFSRSLNRGRKKKNRSNASIIDGSTVTTWATNFIRTLDDATVTDSHGSVNVTEKFRTSVRVSTPNFFDLKKWERPINDYSMQEERFSTRLGYQRIVTLDQSSVTTLNMVGPISYFTAVPAPDLTYGSEAESKAFKSLLSSIDRELDRESSQTPTNIVQFRQVVNMVAKNSKKLLRSYRALKRGDLVTAQRALFGTRKPRFRKESEFFKPSQSVANQWLELQYGWKPLLQDIGNTINALHRDYHSTFRVARGVGTVRSTTETPINAPFIVSLASVDPFPAGKRVTNKTVRVEYGMRYRVSDQDRAVLAQTGFLSPISLAWEVIPFSFVVDWFYPIGPYLESLSAFEGMTFLDGYKSEFVRETSGVLISSNGVHGVYPQRVNIETRCGAQGVAVKFNRTRLTAFPERPRLSFKNPISVVHAQNALALLVANFKR